MKTQLTIRVTEYQAEEIRANADRHSLPVSAYLIALGVSGASPLPPRTRGTGSRRERPEGRRDAAGGRGALAAVRAEPPEAAVRAEPGEPHACADPDCDEYLAATDHAQVCKAHTQRLDT